MLAVKIPNHTAVGMLQTLERQKPYRILVAKLKEEYDLVDLGADGRRILTF
jgi:hypothetical protein